jgi:hypothetical protein
LRYQFVLHQQFIRWSVVEKIFFLLEEIFGFFLKDERLENFFHMYNQLRKQAYSSHHHHSHFQITDKDFKQAIMDTVWAQPEKLIQFLYILLDTHLSLLVRSPILNGHLCKYNKFQLNTR